MDRHSGTLAADTRETPALETGASFHQLGDNVRKGNGVVHERQQAHQLLSPIDVFAPWSGADERALRVRIHRARDRGQARACRSKHGRARAIYWIAAQFAGDWVFQRASVDDLEEVIKGLTWLFLFASLVERTEAPDE